MSQPSHSSTTSPIAGMLWMLLSCVLLSGVAVLGRWAALEEAPTFQIVFLRLAFAIIAFLPLIAWRGAEILKTRHLKLYLVRVVIGLSGMTMWFAALAYITVGEVTAIGFLAPLVGTIGAALILRETVRWRRWTATLVGLLGALIILRPGVAETGVGAWLALGAAIGMGAAGVLIKALTGKDDPDKVVLITLCLQAPIAGIAAAFVWEPVSWKLWSIFAGMGLVGMLGHITLTRAFRAADASLVMSLEFARLPFAVALGWALFGEFIDLWTWIGAGVIFAAALYTARRERQLRKPARGGAEAKATAGPH